MITEAITIESLTEFLAWCSLLNMGLLLFSALMISWFGSWAKNIHGKMFGIPVEQLGPLYFNYLANFKLAVLIFNVIPFCVLYFFF